MPSKKQKPEEIIAELPEDRSVAAQSAASCGSTADRASGCDRNIPVMPGPKTLLKAQEVLYPHHH